MNSSTTPPVVFDDHTPMPFGKYQGKPLVTVPAKYLLWLYDQGCDHPGLKKYLDNNYDALCKEAGRAKR